MSATLSFTGVDRKLEVFTVYYEKLTHLDFKALGPHLVAARIISHEDHQFIQETVESSRAACRVLGKISTSLYIGVDETFDKFLSILESCDDSIVNLRLAEQMRKDLLNTTTGILSNTYSSSAVYALIIVLHSSNCFNCCGATKPSN